MSSPPNPTIEGRSSPPVSEETSFYNNLARLMSWSQPQTNPKLKRIPYDATTFIAAVSELEIDHFPFTWYFGMGELGRGKTAQIQQSVINLETQFAFKRFTFPGSEEPNEAQIIRAALIETLALSHPALRDHPNILKLHGVCWDISSSGNLFRPVLVVEKTSLGDLGHFMSKHGSAIDGNTRVEMCADVIRVVANLHINGIIHGDIKPQNFLVFQEETGDYYLKLGDFGFSSLDSIENEDGNIALPISWPWSAPELSNKQYGLSAPAAKRTDVYSVGLICWWLMLGEKQFDDSQNPWNGSYEWISTLKDSNELMGYARSKMDDLNDVDEEMRCSLLKLFQFTTMSLPDERIPRLTIFLHDVPEPSSQQHSEMFPLISATHH
ncbi:kinase-like domain-containing protein [Usnea florida]